MNISTVGEFGLIERIKHFCPAGPRVVESIGDDTAVLAYSRVKYQLLTTDMMSEDVHFTRRMMARGIGHKALACNISDIAAMGGSPTAAVVSLGLPASTPLKWVEDFYQGMAAVAKQFGVSVVGGDTIKSLRIVINVALLGEVRKKHVVRRSGAKAGDQIFVTGLLGGSLKSGRHLNFTPKVEQAHFLVKNFKPSAMMDISDGLAGDLNHILKASGVGVRLHHDQIPRHHGVTLGQALTDGEDYELLFTVAPARARRLLHWQRQHGRHRFYHVGEIIKDRKALVALEGYKHF